MSVCQADEDELVLSTEALAALTDFANDNSIALNGASNVRLALQEAIDAQKPREEVFSFTYGDETVTLKGLSAELGQTLESTGLTVWRAAKELARYLHEHRLGLKGKQVLELGAGLGLCGILCSKLVGEEGEVLITDGGEEFGDEALQTLEECIATNESKASLERLTWGCHLEFMEEHPTGFDLVMAADVIYEEEAIVPLLLTVCDLLKLREGSIFLLAFARRNVSIDQVLEEASRRGLIWKEVDDFQPTHSTELIYQMSLPPCQQER
ncbi:unnamed protein product [Chrysoparadoxa australica]